MKHERRPQESDPRNMVEAFTAAVSNPEILYRFCKDTDGYKGEGTFNLAALRVLRRYWVYDRQMFYEALTTYDQILEAQEINARLVDGCTPEWACNYVAISFRIFESAYIAPAGRLPLPAAGEQDRGHHAVFVVGWDEAGESLRFVNSWGRTWGDDGHGIVSREYLDRYLNDAWLARRARFGPTRHTWRRLTAAENVRDFARVWMIGNPRWRRRFSRFGRGHAQVLYETVSSADSCPVEIIEVRTGRGFIIGWAHVHHLCVETPRTSVLKELFVWPTIRRKGYGTMLEQLACDRARLWCSERMQMLLHDPDDLRTLLSPGRNFGTALGYQWKWRTQPRSKVKATGEKAL
jgi:GNAT superfamily N-acetyltransferase